MASGGKKKTTMAKLNRESRLRERRQDKQARKDARKLGITDPQEQPGELSLSGDDFDLIEDVAAPAEPAPLAHALADA